VPEENGGFDVPELVPARMVNEYSYCPRLFFLEWVQSRFMDNPDTVEGRYVHRSVDRQGGAAPLASEGELIATRSLLLSSTELGLIARVDLVEGDGATVRPVDTKRGSVPEVEEGAWEPERVQLCVQGLLLREAGYACTEGILYFAESRRRVTVTFDEELIATTLRLLADLRQVASEDIPPPPLLASSKCPRCSLVGICLPDETNTLAARQDWPVRRLLPRDPSPRPLYVTAQGATVGHRTGRVEITLHREVLETVRLIDVSQLCIYGNVQVTTQLLRELFSREIPTCWFSYGGWFSGLAEGLPSKHIELRRRQVAIAGQGGLSVSRKIVEGKIRNCRTLLRRNARTRPEGVLNSLSSLADQASEATALTSLLGLEGAAARLYFSTFESMLREDACFPGGPYSFDGRNRRPPKDPVNCLLSYCYSLLVKDLTAVCWAVGFDPYLGVYHRPRFGRPALALDLAEEFRPLIGESVVINIINNGEIRPSDFTVRAGGVALTAEGRRKVIAAYERRLDVEVRHPTFGYQVNYRRVLDVQARLLAAHLLGEVPDYVAFMTR
jgi:CRISPR-associated protein Cas1